MLRIALLAIAAILLTAQYLSHGGRRLSALAAPVAADELHLGALTLHRCQIGRTGAGSVGTQAAWCTPFDVPEDWSAPAGRHIHLHVAIVRSTATHRQPDLVTFLDGGPGGAATEDFPAIAAALAPLNERHDILLLDQRGTGGSQPLTCPGDEQQNHDISDSSELLEQCLQSVSDKADPRQYTTTVATRDLEAVRQALGAPLLDLVGVSYGTRMAQQYAARFPQAVRSVVLDSAVPNELVLGSDFGRSLEQALQALFQLCTDDSVCHQHFGDSYATLYELRARLRDHPQQVTLNDPNSFQTQRVPMSADDLVGIARFYAYNPLTAALLPLMLHEAQHGNYSPLLSQKRLLNDTLGTELSGGMALSVLCAEDADLLHPDPEEAATLMGSGEYDRIQRACSIWPHGDRPADFHEPWHSDLPVLILAGQYDPVTPPDYARRIVANLTRGRVLLAAGQGHSVMTAGCMPRLMKQFVEAMQPLQLDAHCLEQLGPTPAFVDFNGAPP